MNRYFGQPWDAPIVKHAEPTATPVGRPCVTCGELIAEGDQGMVTPAFCVVEGGRMHSHPEAEHRGCMLLGLVGHMAGTCLCHDGLGSIRERGEATVAWAEANRL